LVIPNTALTLRGGAVSLADESNKECQADLVSFARKRGIALDTPWRELTDANARGARREGEWTKNVWYGVRRFFAWLETKAYKMHIRVLLSRYRSYHECTACQGSRLKPEALSGGSDPGRGSPKGSPSINIRERDARPIDRNLRFFWRARPTPAAR